MGLDMYLEAERYVSGYEHSGDDEKERYDAAVKVAGVEGLVDPELWVRSATVSVTVAYWRKANQIHAWFVDNVQDGVDECQRAHVEREQLQELRDTCAEALAAHAAGDLVAAGETLPPREGFFFGSTDIDQYWVDDIENTIAQLDRVLKASEPREDDSPWSTFSFYYHSSW